MITRSRAPYVSALDPSCPVKSEEPVDMAKRFKAWYIPQVPMKPFEIEASTAAKAQTILNIIINFSIFEFENKVKPDYCDAGGVSEWNVGEQEWVDIEEMDG
jgi:hypothetical protein